MQSEKERKKATKWEGKIEGDEVSEKEERSNKMCRI